MGGRGESTGGSSKEELSRMGKGCLLSDAVYLSLSSNCFACFAIF